MPLPRLSRAVAPLLSAGAWGFAPDLPVIDFVYGGIESWWLAMQLLHPEQFNRGNLAGMQWAPDVAWIVFVGALTLLHAAGLLDRHFYRLRAVSCLLSAWYWICISISITRISLSPGTGTYGILGALALGGAVYLTGRDQRRG